LLDSWKQFLDTSNAFSLGVTFIILHFQSDHFSAINQSADPEGAFVNSLSMEEKRQLLRTLSGKQADGDDSARKKAKKDKKSKKDAKESKRHKKDKKKKKKRSRSSSSSSSDSESDSDSKRRKKN